MKPRWLEEVSMKVVVVAHAAPRNRMPEFLQSEEEDNDDVDESLGVSRMKGGTRRRYGGRQDFDDLGGGADDACNQNRPIRSKKG